ncbi:MAG: hypothetical protein Q7U47_01590, partial [Paludibacter sp.]|nr:hypothetical protein [Paludibacter sp.]
MLVSSEFGQYFVRLPLKKAAKIVHGNALQIKWNTLIIEDTITISSQNATVILNEPAPIYQVNIQTSNLTIIDERNTEPIKNDVIHSKFDYILGNPPFIGSKIMTQ